MALIENIQREDLNPMEAAAAYQRLAEEFHLKQDDIAAQVGKDRATVANYLRLLKLPEEVRGNVASGALSMGHARAIVALTSESDQRRLARDVVSRGLSVRETEALVKKEIGTKAWRREVEAGAAEERRPHARRRRADAHFARHARRDQTQGQGRDDHDRVYQRDRTAATVRVPDRKKINVVPRRKGGA
jgi:ParB family chromosome partitioning protein